MITILTLIIFILLQFVLSSTAKQKTINYRDEMRSFVGNISSISKKKKPGFIVIPQNGLELVTYSGKPDGKPVMSYLSAIEGVGCDDIFYGYKGAGVRTEYSVSKYFLDYLLIYKRYMKKVLIIDYVKNSSQAGSSYRKAGRYGFISFHGERPLSAIPARSFNINNNSVSNLSSSKNFLYLINGSRFRSPDSFLSGLRETGYDLLIIDAFYHGRILTKAEVGSLKRKPSGKRRLVISYMSIGEAEDYRYYWKTNWNNNAPSFLHRENQNWKGNYKVKYWMSEWKEIISGREDGTGFRGSYLKKILDAGFDGVYLDIVDAAIYFEELEY